MIGHSRAALVLAIAAASFAAPAVAQVPEAERGYFRAVARYFRMPEQEVEILGSWDVPADEVPVLLFVANRAGVSAEALVAMREAGRSWTELAGRFRIGAPVLHVPLDGPQSAGRLAALYTRYQETAVERWGEIPLASDEIVALVNIRVLAESMGIRAEEVSRRTEGSRTFVEIYWQLVH